MCWVFTRTDGPLSGTFPAPVCTGARWCVSAIQFPQQTAQHPAAEEDLCEIRPLVERFAKLFGHDAQALMAGPFTVVTPEGRNPYQQMYVAN